LGVRLDKEKMCTFKNWWDFRRYSHLFKYVFSSAVSIVEKSCKSAKLGHFFYVRHFVL
jgi:hypothetical protein